MILASIRKCLTVFCLLAEMMKDPQYFWGSYFPGFCADGYGLDQVMTMTIFNTAKISRDFISVIFLFYKKRRFQILNSSFLNLPDWQRFSASLSLSLPYPNSYSFLYIFSTDTFFFVLLYFLIECWWK